jgi:hypothetical protein
VKALLLLSPIKDLTLFIAAIPGADSVDLVR